MNRYDVLMERVARGETILLDGATDTEVEHRGVPQLAGAWNGGGALSHPDIVRQVHADYIDIGSDIVIANTFATHRSALKKAGVDGDFDAYNRRGVELAIEARETSGRDSVVVAGGMSHWCWVGDEPTVDELRVDATDQARTMAEAGADVLFLEMMIEIDRMLAVLDGALASGLPIWLGFACGDEHGGGATDRGVVRLRGGETLAGAVAALRGIHIDVVNIMHTDVAVIGECLDALGQCWDGPVGAYAHSGAYIDGEWVLGSELSPDEYLGYVERWRSQGLRIVGGCCGIGPEHIKLL